MLTTTCHTPQDLAFIRVELQSVGFHPGRDGIGALRRLRLVRVRILGQNADPSQPQQTYNLLFYDTFFDFMLGLRNWTDTEQEWSISSS